jgi:hypothetical protein
MTHKAVQLLTLAARANLEPAADDSHSNLGWDTTSKRFLSQPMPLNDRAMLIGLSLSPLRLEVVQDETTRDKLDMEGQTTEDALQWLDRQLREAELNPASKVTLPYELPEAVAKTERLFPQAVSVQLTALAAWFDLANTVISDFAKNYADLKPGPSPARCWPHHFDIATYVQLEAGSAEAARGIGLGMSPGDESYGQPYFYVNPWPHLDPTNLPDPPHPGHWHTDGYVGAVATAEQIVTLDDVPEALSSFVESAFAVGRAGLEA